MTFTAVLFALLGAVCVLAVLIGLPGTWIMIGLAVAIELLDGWILGAPTSTFGGWVLLGAVALGIVGEGVELASSALGSKGGGGSRRGMVGSMIGGVAGGVAGTFMIPVPLFGTLMGVLLGTFAGAYVGETSGAAAKASDEALKPALAATAARVVGTVAKAGVSTTVWITLTVAAFWG